jgi:hypothetical protein
MICSSVRIVRFIVHPFLGVDSSRNWKKNPVAGHKQSRRVIATPTPQPFEFAET